LLKYCNLSLLILGASFFLSQSNGQSLSGLMPLPFFVCGVSNVDAKSLNFSHSALSRFFSNSSKPASLFSNCLGVKLSSCSGERFNQPKATTSKSS